MDTLVITVTMTDDPQTEHTRVKALEDQAQAAANEHPEEHIEVDGWGMGEGVRELFVYAPEADRAWDILGPVLRPLVPAGTELTRVYGQGSMAHVVTEQLG